MEREKREKYKSHGRVTNCGIVDGREQKRVETERKVRKRKQLEWNVKNKERYNSHGRGNSCGKMNEERIDESKE